MLTGGSSRIIISTSVIKMTSLITAALLPGAYVHQAQWKKKQSWTISAGILMNGKIDAQAHVRASFIRCTFSEPKCDVRYVCVSLTGALLPHSGFSSYCFSFYCLSFPHLSVIFFCMAFSQCVSSMCSGDLPSLFHSLTHL